MNLRRGQFISGSFLLTVVAAAASLFGSPGCDLAKPTIKTHGFRAETTTAETGSGQQYVAFVPHNNKSGEKPPVILFLNGWGQNGNDGLRQVSNNFGQDVWRRRYNQKSWMEVS